eukprot:g5758.t1
MWKCTADSMDELVSNLSKAGIIKNDKVREAMLQTDRAKYILPSAKEKLKSTYEYGPYADSPQSIGHGVTISAPFIHATALEALASHVIQPNSRVLDVGCGSGILSACLRRLGSETSKVVGIEVVKELVSFSIENLKKDGFHPNDDDNFIIKHGDGWKGASDLGPFDAIHVGAFVREIPTSLLEQLRPGGRMVIPTGNEKKQMFVQIDKSSTGTYTSTKLCPIRFVPLVQASASGVKDRKVDYDKRYSKGWAYGKKPNIFLVEMANLYFPGEDEKKNILSLGEGQGRNACYLAQLGHSITATDASSVGMTKTMRLADQLQVTEHIRTVITDLREPCLSILNGTNKYDIIYSIFCAFEEKHRSPLYKACAKTLKPGGLFVYEGFAPRHHEYRGYRALGPPQERMASLDSLERDFKDSNFEILLAKETERKINEGKFHRGSGIVVQFVAQKKMNENLSYSYSNSIDTVFDNFASNLNISTKSIAENAARKFVKHKNSENQTNSESNFFSKDLLLYSANSLLSIAVKISTQQRRCRYCWTTQDNCICKSIIPQIKSFEGTKLQKFRWIFLIHPSEFLRPFSTSKVAAQYLCQHSTSISCDYFIFGDPTHDEKLNQILKVAFEKNEKIFFLFPDKNENQRKEENVISKLKNSNGEKDEEITILVPDGTLKPGQGLGRITTLEACALFLREVCEIEKSNSLLNCLEPLVKYTKMKLTPICRKEKIREVSKCKINRDFVKKVQNVAENEKNKSPPLGLRSCRVCGEHLATPKRMKSHLRGRKHCENVVHLMSCCDKSESASSTMTAQDVYDTYSTKILASSIAEPPDIALMELVDAVKKIPHSSPVVAGSRSADDWLDDYMADETVEGTYRFNLPTRHDLLVYSGHKLTWNECDDALERREEYLANVEKSMQGALPVEYVRQGVKTFSSSVLSYVNSLRSKEETVYNKKLEEEKDKNSLNTDPSCKQDDDCQPEDFCDNLICTPRHDAAEGSDSALKKKKKRTLQLQKLAIRSLGIQMKGLQSNESIRWQPLLLECTNSVGAARRNLAAWRARADVEERLITQRVKASEDLENALSNFEKTESAISATQKTQTTSNKSLVKWGEALNRLEKLEKILHKGVTSLP